MLKETKYIFF